MAKNYHKDQEYFTRSYLVNYLISPLHAKTELEAEETSTPALLFGQAYHALLGKTFFNDFTILDEAMRPEKDKTMASNLNKAWKEKMASGPQKLITLEDYQKMEKMYIEMQKNEYVTRMNAFQFTQEEVIKAVVDGYKVKCKPDCMLPERKLLVDWKTTAELPINEFTAQRLVRKYNYHFQAAFYCDITGMDHMLFFFQEKVAPFDVVPVLIRKDSPLMEEGRELWKHCAKMATECHKKNEWLGIASTLTDNCITL